MTDFKKIITALTYFFTAVGVLSPTALIQPRLQPEEHLKRRDTAIIYRLLVRRLFKTTGQKIYDVLFYGTS